MATCMDCGQDMLTASTCTIESFVFPDGRILARIPFGSEKPPWRMNTCGDCGVGRGGYHHPGCDIERCPSCLHQYISCGCADDLESACGDDDSELVDVPVAIEIVSKIILENPPDVDHLFMDPVAICGHVGRGHVRKMVRSGELPLDEWFELARSFDDETAAVLFTCRSSDPENVGKADLEVAGAIAAFAKGKSLPPWELVFVTRRGNFKASDLLGLPGHPEFQACTWDGNG